MRLTPTQKLELVERWKTSGLSRRQFALSVGIPQNTFLKWAKGLALDDRKNREGRQQFAQLREQGLTPWKISIALSMPYENCRRWERDWRAGKLGI